MIKKRRGLADNIVESTHKTVLLGFAVVSLLVTVADAWFLRENLIIKHQNVISSLLKVSQQYYFSGDIVSMRNYLNTMASQFNFSGSLRDQNQQVLWLQEKSSADHYDSIFSQVSEESTRSIELFLEWDIKKEVVQHYRDFCAAFLMFLIFSFSLFKIQNRLLFTRLSGLKSFKEKLKMQANAINFSLPPDTEDELSDVQSWFQLIGEHWVLATKKAEAVARQTAFSEVAAQVSHDIKSPLSALNMLIGQMSQIPENHRIVMRSAIQRINDIANQLLQESKQIAFPAEAVSKTDDSGENLMKVELLSPIIDILISEKRVQFREMQGFEIEADLSNGYGLFAHISSVELKRTLSNLTNNAAEALKNGRGKFFISIHSLDTTVILEAKDNGKGIPKHILERLGQIGVTHGKEGIESGSGLGVYHAKKTIESFGGRFEIFSQEGIGTKIVMTFPKAPAPNWFVEKLSISPDCKIVSIDDDLSIHHVWKGRFESKNLSCIGVEHLTFTSVNEFKMWVKADEIRSMRLYLCDYEFLNQNSSGLDIIEELGIGSQAILVTSRYEEDRIRERCEKLGVRLIPKAMAGFVPIEVIKSREIFDALLIDDDQELIHLIWNRSATAAGKKFKAYAHPKQFFAEAPFIDFHTPIYIDSNLGSGLRGEEISKKIHEIGFKNIFLCTGYRASDYPSMHWIKGIVGKDPIF
ncbi:MAG: hypothetical protein B7Y39_02180 [Bdellovibrio sp. 28-41-41]|nr:MAG: hypothetical protein B7Y39_02180 [Bdellovibrio sp. 28-41-41]